MRKQHSQVTACAAVDLGATSGRVIVGCWKVGSGLTLTEVHRFANRVHRVGGHEYWDLGGLWAEIVRGLHKARQGFPRLASVGVCTWGVDHALVSRRGRLAHPVYAYRDQRTLPKLGRLLRSPRAHRAIYGETGIPGIFYNTSLQLAETLEAFPALSQTVDRCLFLPDYFNFLLSGRMANELSIASTSQLLSADRQDWSDVALRKFGVPGAWFSRPVQAGADLGTHQDVGSLRGLRVIAVPGHDTACAFDAMPTVGNRFDLYINSGTWSLVGCERNRPLREAGALEAGICNERTGTGAFRPLKSVAGLWLIERLLGESGSRIAKSRDWARLLQECATQPKPPVLLDCNASDFQNPSSMRTAVDRFLRRRRAPVPANVAGYARLIFESLAAGHAQAGATFSSLTRRKFERIVLVGGGSRNHVLCQATATLSRIPVTAYALEASAVGNIGCQLMALGVIGSREDMRVAVAEHSQSRTFMPGENACHP